MELIDSHCHLESFIQANRLETLISNAKAANLAKMIAVGTDAEDWSLYHDVAAANPGFIYYTVGIHPCHVDDNWRDDFQLLAPYFTNDCLPVALGEIGLDNFHLPSDSAEAEKIQKRQKAAFKAQLELALQLDCPVIIHSRHAFQECVEMIDASGIDWSKVVFHCFSEGPDSVEVLNKRGGRASFTGIVTYKNAQPVRDAMLKQGIDSLMIETDSPYLAPVPYRGKENEPAYTKEIGRHCAELFGLSFEDFANKVTANTVEFFGLQ